MGEHSVTKIAPATHEPSTKTHLQLSVNRENMQVLVDSNRTLLEVIEEAGRIAAQPVIPVNNTDLDALWRKKMIPVFVHHALQDLDKR